MIYMIPYDMMWHDLIHIYDTYIFDIIYYGMIYDMKRYDTT